MFFTKFVCRFDQLEQAKSRHLQRVDSLRDEYTVHFASEQAYNLGRSNLTFDLLFPEIDCFCDSVTEEVKEKYSAFQFITIVDLPDIADKDEDWNFHRSVSDTLEIDFEEGVPAKFPSRTRGIVVSPTGRLTEKCIYQ